MGHCYLIGRHDFTVKPSFTQQAGYNFAELATGIKRWRIERVKEKKELGGVSRGRLRTEDGELGENGLGERRKH